MLDAHAITIIGAVIGQAAGLYGLFYAWAKRTYWADFFRGQHALTTDLRRVRTQAAEYRERMESAEALSATLRPYVTELRLEVDDLKARFHALEPMRIRIDAMVDWMNLMIPYVVFLEDLAKEAKLDLKGKSMPAVPAVMREHTEGLL